MRKRGKRHAGLVLTNPLIAMQKVPEAERNALLTDFHSALSAMRSDPEPTVEHWRVLSDAVNVLETLLLQGKLLQAEMGPLLDASVEALALAGERHREGKRLGLDGKGMQALAEVLAAYADCLEGLTAMEMAKARKETERRMQVLLRGKTPNGVKVITV